MLSLCRMVVGALLLALSLCCSTTLAFVVTPSSPSTTTRSTASRLQYQHEQNSPLELSAYDRERLEALKSRQLTLPVLLLGSLVPGQSLKFTCSDTKLQAFLNQHNKLAVVGTDGNKQPLLYGVVCDVKIVTRKQDKWTILLNAATRLSVHRFQPERGVLWAECQVQNSASVEFLSHNEVAATQYLIMTIPKTYKLWKDLQNDCLLNAREIALGGLPLSTNFANVTEYWNALCFFIAAMLTHEMDVRYHMLQSRNPFERTLLASSALQKNIQALRIRHGR